MNNVDLKCESNVDKEKMEWPHGGIETVAHCPVCGSSSRSKIHDRLTDKVFFCAPGEWTLYRCDECQGAYLDPRPTKETIGIAYRDYFTHEVDGGEALNGIRRIKRMLANGYRNRKYRTSDKPSSVIGYMLAMCMPKQRAIMDATMRNLPLAWKGARLLDIGCGNGDFLLRAKNAGWEVMGVDADKEAVELARARGIEVLHGDVDTVLSMKASFDGITLSHVIEHVHDPVALLKNCYSLLRPGGWLWIDTPNFKSLGYKKYKNNWLHLDPPRHLVLFTTNSLKNALHESGFISIADEPWRPIYLSAARASENIAENRSPFIVKRLPSFRLIFESWVAEMRAKKRVEDRDFICVKAMKSDSQSL